MLIHLNPWLPPDKLISLSRQGAKNYLNTNPINLFRATQAEQKLRRERISGKANANLAHQEVGRIVRQTIRQIGGTMPEDLPTVESIKTLETKDRNGAEALEAGEGHGE